MGILKKKNIKPSSTAASFALSPPHHLGVIICKGVSFQRDEILSLHNMLGGLIWAISRMFHIISVSSWILRFGITDKVSMRL